MAGRDFYILQAAGTGSYKIGRSDDVEARIKQLQTGCPNTLRLIVKIPNWGYLERETHQRLSRYRIRIGKGEWFAEPCLGELPLHIYEKIPEAILETPDWYKQKN